MGRPHRFAGSRLTARTTLPRARVLELGRAAAEATVGNTWDGRKELRLLASGPDGDRYAIHGALLHKPKQLELRLTVADVEDGARREVATEITWYVTTQSKMYVVIPMGRKTMVAHTAYLELMEHLAGLLRAEDPAAAITVFKGEQVISSTGTAAAPVAAAAPVVAAPLAAAPLPPAPLPPPDGRVCASCSEAAHDGDRYCGRCGTVLPTAATAAPTIDGAVR